MTRQLHTICCIDDEQDILDVLQLALETVGGFTVTCMNTPADAVEEVRANAPDLVLLDVMMPGTDGPTVLAALRDEPATRHLPVIFMTARAQPDEIRQYLDLGAAGVITKPFDPMSISEEIRSVWKEIDHEL